jgi:DNA-binding LacI/PurR family transcriptional regulator
VRGAQEAAELSEQRIRRVTIRDIAERAGVSKGAVSYALNGRPGVSDETRGRILAIAEELGWYPNRAARALSAARVDACGLVLARPARSLALEPFFMEFIAGVETELSARSIALTIQLARDVSEEIAVYRRWWGEHRVDGVLVVDLRLEDPRLDELVRLGLPAVVVGGPLENRAQPSVWHDEAAVVVEAVQYLAALGHTRVAHVAGIGAFVHTKQRTDAFSRAAAELGLDGVIVETDYSAEAGARATRRLLSSPSRPSAILFDSDLLAVTGLGVVQQMGFAVPDDVSIIGWDDSLISQVVHPPLTAITRDISAYGATAARRLLVAIEGQPANDVETVKGELTTRGSTARRAGG